MSTKYYLVRKANGVALGKLKRYQSNNVSNKLKSVCDEISVGIYIGDMSSGGFFHINFLNDKYKLRNHIRLNSIMELADIKKNVVTTYHYTTIGGEELVFENERDCYKTREKDIRAWHSRLISNEYLDCDKGVYLIKCKREMYEGKNFIVFNGMYLAI